MSKKIKAIPYLQIIQDAVKISWKNTYLWWFGFFIALTSLGGIFNYSSRSEKSWHAIIKKQEVFYFSSQNIYWVGGLTLLLVLFYVLLVSLNIIGRGALIDSISKQLRKKPANFKTGLTAGRKYFWKILILVLILSLSIFFLMIIIFTPVIFLFANHNYFIGSLLGFLALLILIPLLLLVSYLKVYGYLYVVLGQLKVMPALENAYNLLRKNLGASLIILLLFIPLNIIWMLVILMSILPVGFIFLCLGTLMFFLAGSIGVGITMLIAVISFLGIAIFLRSIYEVFIQIIWILFFQIIAQPEVFEPIKEMIVKTTVTNPAIPVVEYRKK